MSESIGEWLESQQVRSWFDVGLLLDSLGDNRDLSRTAAGRDTAEGRFLASLASGVALISFESGEQASRDEVSRYAEVLEYLISANSEREPNLWWIDDDFSAESESLRALRWREIDTGSEQTHRWDGYDDLFETRLDRGSGAYNALIGKIWTQTCAIARRLAEFVEEQDIRLLVPVNVCSTPAHISLSLAIVLVSERLGIPVMSINHDFWWEDPAYRPDSGSMPDSRGQFFANAHLGEVFSLIEVLFPWSSLLWAHTCHGQTQQQRLTREFGFNPARVALLQQADGRQLDSQTHRIFAELLAILGKGLDKSARQHQRDITRAAFAAHQEATRKDERFQRLALTQNREYMPGLNKLEYLSTLKSLIDPSAFRMEEKALRGRIYAATQAILARRVPDKARQVDVLLNVSDIFVYYDGEDDLVVDHSLSYRHRHQRHYPWRKLTEPELVGVISAIIEQHAAYEPGAEGTAGDVSVGSPSGDAADQLTTIAGTNLAIDHSARLADALASGRPVIWLPGDDWKGEALGWVSAQLASVPKAAITLLASRHWGRSGPEYEEARQWLASASPALSEAISNGRLSVQASDVLSAGTHLAHLGDAGDALAGLADRGAFVIACGSDNCYTLDTLDIESFRIACAAQQPFASYMGLSPGEGLVLHVPAGLRPSLAYPTPIQTPVEFAAALQSDLYRQAAEKLGEQALLEKLREDADSNGTPLATALTRLLEAGASTEPGDNSALNYRLLTGVHDNGDPWSGATACLSGVGEGQWQFHASFARQSSDTVLSLVEHFRRAGGPEVDVAWNGGFILNPELVGKLGLPEAYIGTPLGLLIDQGRVLAPPLFNKPAMAFLAGGGIDLREANCGQGMTIGDANGGQRRFDPESYNNDGYAGARVYDLMHQADTIDASGRILYRLAGDQVLERLEPSEKPVALLPVGLTLSFPADNAPDWQSGDRLNYALDGWDGVDIAIEAGPLLIRDGEISVEMEQGGWTLPTSIRTQAARIDYLHMRGPKIGVGMTASGDLVIAAVNGRVRESVGATHIELAQILKDLGAEQAMGFDPGGSVTLVVKGQQLNISPYNKDYLSSPYSLPPQPRFVGNAILATPSGR